MAELQRVLSYKVILLLTMNSMMGTGIYFLPALGAKLSGPASILSWLLISFLAIYTAMCFAELAGMFPKAGGIYEYSKHAYGKFPSFLMGWTAWIVGNITIAMLIVGAIQYLLPFEAPLVKIGICLFFVFAFNFIAYRGMKTSAFMLVTFAVINITILVSLVVVGLFKINIANYEPFFAYPISLVFITLFYIAEAFFGWETTTFLAEETKDPEKVIPKALIIGTVIIAIIALFLVTVSLGVIPWEIFSESQAPLADLAHSLVGGYGRDVIAIATYLVIIGAAAGWIVSSPRLLLALTRDKLFLPQLGKIHPKYHTPSKAILFQTIATSVFIITGFGSYKTLLTILVPIVFFMYSAVIFSVFVLRVKRPELKRAYKAPFANIGPIVMVIINLLLVYAWLSREKGAYQLLLFAISFIILAIPVYFLLEMYYNPKTIRGTQNLMAYFALLTERIILPKRVRHEIIALLGNIKDKTILEFGCSVGTLTWHLAEEVGKDGKIYATDLSERETRITKKRIDRKGHKHVSVLYDKEHHRRIHPDVPNIHSAVSVGMLGYLQDVKNVLDNLNKRLKKGSKICFVDYDNFLGVIPNKEWLGDDKQIKRIFYNSGFMVDVVRRRGFAWNYIYIYGVKVRDV